MGEGQRACLKARATHCTKYALFVFGAWGLGQEEIEKQPIT